MTYNRRRVGQKGQIVIPKEIREKTGIRAGSEVSVEVRDDNEVIIKKSSPPTKSYVDYYIASYSKKLKRAMNIKKIIEDEVVERKRLH